MAERIGKIFTIHPGADFSKALAAGLVERYHDASDPLSLANITILVPTRRSVASLRNGFLKILRSTPVILPRIRPIGDVTAEEVDLGAAVAALEGEVVFPPAIPALRRDFILAQLIERWAESEVTAGARLVGLDPAQAFRLAVDLGQFLDMAATEDVAFDDMQALVPEEYALHWQKILDFLAIVTEVWPKILAEQGLQEPMAYRAKLIKGLAATWQKTPPSGPVVVAGSTGTIPATATLMQAVLSLQDGMVVLPGLDLGLAESAWEAIGETHPQFGLRNLLKRLDATRAEVSLWPQAPASEDLEVRTRLIQEALRPAETTEGWRDVVEGQKLNDLEAAFAGLSLVEAPDLSLEAKSIALMMREALEVDGQTIALVTPDRRIARRVTNELIRWQITVNDSAGSALDNSVPGTFLNAILDLAFGDDPFSPGGLLALLKHPLFRVGRTRPALRAQAALLEVHALRGPRPAPGFAGLNAALANDEALTGLIDQLEQAFEPLLQAGAPTLLLGEHLKALVKTAEILANSEDTPGATRLWSGDGGEGAAGLVRELMAEAGAASKLTAPAFRRLFQTVIAGRVVRPKFGLHPRAFIWGPLEARLQSADVIILAGLNEGSWPGEVGMDPWLSRPMRGRLGLPLPERRIGLAAHDFAQLASGPKVIMTRSLKDAGAPTIASRWVMRLKNMLKGLSAEKLLQSEQDYINWAQGIDRPDKVISISEPLPRPPVAARPRRLSVTEIETWVRDPYAIYAKHILHLRPLDPLDADAGAAERGNIVHKALELFIKNNMTGAVDPQAGLDELLRIGEEVFEDVSSQPEVRLFWWPRFLAVADWFIAREAALRDSQSVLDVEVEGELTLQAPAGEFLLTGRADRLDRLVDGTIAIYDYKTGMVPSGPMLKSGLAPQLPLEAVMLEAGAFKGLAAELASTLAYIRMTGGDPPGEVRSFDPAKDELIEAARAGLEARIAKFDSDETPYHSRLRPMFEDRINSYDHLARVKEWSVYGASE